MQFLCDAPALAFLRGERLASALATFLFQPVEHVVEDGDELADLAWACRLESDAWSMRVDGAHQAHQPLKRCERGA